MAEYFGYCPRRGFKEFVTQEGAIEYAENSLKHFRNESGEGWDDEVAGICWGEIKQQAAICDEMTTEEAEEKGIVINPDCDGYCDYRLEDA